LMRGRRGPGRCIRLCSGTWTTCSRPGLCSATRSRASAGRCGGTLACWPAG
jgi:hypothetical protein